MASMDYDFQDYEKIADVASEFNTTVDEIMRINNVLPPYPTYVRDLPQEVIENGTIKLPFVTNGRQTFENYYNTAAETLGVEYETAAVCEEETLRNYTARYYSRQEFGDVDVRPGKNLPMCYIIIDGRQWTFPCYPESVSDSNTANYNAVSILGRSEPFQYYTGSGPRTVSVKFDMHAEMMREMYDPDTTYVYRLVSAIEAACYPNYGSGIAAPAVTFVVANNIQIRGIISSVNTDYDGPILDMGDTNNANPMSMPKYAKVGISFSVTEVTGTPFSKAEITRNGGWR